MKVANDPFSGIFTDDYYYSGDDDVLKYGKIRIEPLHFGYQVAKKTQGQ